MAAFTQIPELGIAELLGGVLGDAAGLLRSTATSTLESLEDQIKEKSKQYLMGLAGEMVSGSKASIDPQEWNKFIDTAEKTLDSVERTLDKIETTANSVSTALIAIEIPIQAAQIALSVLKLSPIPPVMTMVAGADLLGETIAQILQIVSSLRNVLKHLSDLFRTIREWIARLRRLLQSLRIQIALEDAGLPAEVLSYVSELVKLVEKGLDDTGEYPFVTLGSSSFDSEDSYIQGLIDSASIGDIVSIPTDNPGDWITDAYTSSIDKPATPDTREIVPEGWTSVEPQFSDGIWWWSRATVSGKTGKAGIWSEPVSYLSKFPKGTSSGVVIGQGGYEDVLIGGIDLLNSLSSNVGSIEDLLANQSSVSTLMSGLDGTSSLNTENVASIVIKGTPEDAFGMLSNVLEDLKNLSEDQKDTIKSYLDTIPTVTPSEAELLPGYHWTGPDGEVYDLNIVVDPRSPEVSYRRYVEVTDRNGIVVFTGPKTFATNNDILIEETKVRLGQLFI